ncbi:response regulator [Myxococcota bacterium]|nr:response regulator [Myxococcota bacterium]MBU1382369.1 response regulator [Myxococcota bacterium]MBU1498706.1 response regulator [Myxococcota bacterium]
MAKKIICIDDDQDVIDFLSITLGAKGYELETASDGEEGYNKACSFKPDMIVLDVMMSHSTEGFHTAYKFRQNEDLKYVPILMLTSINQEFNYNFSMEKDGEFLPVDDFVEKPISSQLLLEKTAKLLETPKDQINISGKKKVI